MICDFPNKRERIIQNKSTLISCNYVDRKKNQFKQQTVSNFSTQTSEILHFSARI